MLPKTEKFVKLKYVNPTRLKFLMLMFFGTGIIGILIGLIVAPPVSSDSSLLITFMGVINLSLGGFFGWIFLTFFSDPEQPLKSCASCLNFTRILVKYPNIVFNLEIEVL